MRALYTQASQLATAVELVAQGWDVRDFAPLAILCDFARNLILGGMSENVVAQQIVDAAFRVHTKLGPGLLESVYEAALAYELEKRGLRLSRQQAIPLVYEAVR